MKAAILRAFDRLEAGELLMPQPGPYDCLVRIDACAICTGTDLNIVSGRFAWPVEPPLVPGHESTGLIVEVGDRVRAFRPGQRVTRPAAIYPGERRDGIGSQWGGFAEFGLVRDCEAADADGLESGGMLRASRVPLPEDVDKIAGALSINQREILSVCKRAGFDGTSRVVVIGSGYNGLLYSFFAKQMGARTVVMVGSPGRTALATGSFLADALIDYHDPTAAEFVRRLLGAPATHVIDAVGTVPSMELARSLLSPGTRFGRYGVHDVPGTDPILEELKVTNPMLEMWTDEAGATDEWYEQFQRGLYRRRGMCDDVVPLEGINEALERLRRREAVKIVVTL
jgi:threonine dehydrogenase-like Zn-dependent dehydrogenase